MLRHADVSVRQRRRLRLLLLSLIFSVLTVCSLIRDNLLAGDFTVNMRLLQVGVLSGALLASERSTSDLPPPFQDYPISDVHTILTKAEELRDVS